MKTHLVWVVGRHNGGGYKAGELFLALPARFIKASVKKECLEAVSMWCRQHAVALVAREVAE